MSQEPSNEQAQEVKRDQLIDELTAIAEDPQVLQDAADLARKVHTFPPEDLHRPFTI